MSEVTREDRIHRMRCRGIRGATTVAENSREAILSATRELLTLIAERNDIDVEEIGSIFFTVSDDLDAEHPALAARQLGWTDVALLCGREIPVPGSLSGCVRVLLHVNTMRSQKELRHVYLHAAVVLRPGWAGESANTPSDVQPPQEDVSPADVSPADVSPSVVAPIEMPQAAGASAIGGDR